MEACESEYVKDYLDVVTEGFIKFSEHDSPNIIIIKPKQFMSLVSIPEALCYKNCFFFRFFFYKALTINQNIKPTPSAKLQIKKLKIVLK